MPERVGRKVTESCGIPTLGIGAGRHCDGQVLVFHDFAGLSQGQVPRFVRRYADLAGAITEATRRYIEDVRSGAFPSEAETYSMPAAVDAPQRR